MCFDCLFVLPVRLPVLSSPACLACLACLILPACLPTCLSVCLFVFGAPTFAGVAGVSENQVLDDHLETEGLALGTQIPQSIETYQRPRLCYVVLRTTPEKTIHLESAS